MFYGIRPIFIVLSIYLPSKFYKRTSIGTDSINVNESISKSSRNIVSVTSFSCSQCQKITERKRDYADAFNI